MKNAEILFRSTFFSELRFHNEPENLRLKMLNKKIKKAKAGIQLAIFEFWGKAEKEF